MRLAAAVQWYGQGRISQEWAAKIAGLDRTDHQHVVEVRQTGMILAMEMVRDRATGDSR